MHGNRNSVAQDVAVAAGWVGNRFHLAVHDHGKGIKDGIDSGARGMDGMGLNIIFSFPTESYVDIDDQGHTLTLVRDLDAVEVPPLAQEGEKTDMFGTPLVKIYREIEKVREIIRSGKPLPVKAKPKLGMWHYDVKQGKMVSFDD